MKIQEGLVWDKHTGELLGFVDLGDLKLNYATVLATHILVFLVKSVVNPLSYSFATLRLLVLLHIKFFNFSGKQSTYLKI